MRLNIRNFINLRALLVFSAITFVVIALFAQQIAGPEASPSDWLPLALGFTGLMAGASILLGAILSFTGQGGWAVGQAQQLARQGQTADALARFDAILRRQPRQPQALIGRATLLQAQDRLAPALADLNQAIVNIPHVSNFPDPVLSQAYVQRGQVRELLGDQPGALGDWERASRAAPGQPEPYLLRGRAELDQGHYYQGQELLKQAVKIASFYLDQNRGDGQSRAGMLNLRGMANTLLDQPQRALADLEAALTIDPRAWAVHYNLAGAYLKMGHREPALAALGEAIKLNPGAAVAARRSMLFRPLQDDPAFEELLARAPRAA